MPELINDNTAFAPPSDATLFAKPGGDGDGGGMPIPADQKMPQEQAVPITPDKPEAEPTNQPAHVEEALRAIVPKDLGDALVLGMAKTLLDKQKETAKKPEQSLGNRMLKHQADVLNDMGKKYGLEAEEPVNETDSKDVAARQKEFDAQLEKIYGIPKDGLKEGDILPLPKDWNSEELRDIKRRQPNWTGEYIQLRSDPKTGKMSWEGANKPTAMKGTLTPVTVAANTFGKKWDGKKWVKAEPDEATVKPYWEKEYNSPDISEGAIRLSGVLQSEQKEGNYRLTKLMMDNPKLYRAYKAELETADVNSVSTPEGSAKLLQNAIAKTYQLDKSPHDIQKSISDYQFNVAVDAYSKFQDFSRIYDRQQDAITAKVSTIADATLRAMGKGDELDKLSRIRAQMMRDPKSLTETDRNNYYKMSMDVIKASAGMEQVQPYIQQFNKNIGEYKEKLQANMGATNILGTPDGRKIMNLVQNQVIGTDIANKLLNYFPKLKGKIEKQEAIDKAGTDRTSLLKSLLRGINTSFEDLSRGRQRWAQMLGIMTPDEVIQEQRDLKQPYGNLGEILYTPNRPEQDEKGKTNYWNIIANFGDKTAEFSGTMAPYLISGGTGAASIIPETGMFFTSGYNDFYREAKEAGLSNQDAAVKAAIGGTTLALTQLFIPKAQLVNRQIVDESVTNLLRRSARPDAGALQSLFSRFVNPEVFKASYKGGLAVFSNDVAQNLINQYYNDKDGTAFKTTADLGSMMEQSLMFGVNASITNALFKGGSKSEQDAARSMFMAHAEKYPVEALRSIDDALAISFADDHYDRAKLLALKSDVASMHQMQFPKDYTLNQKVAAWALQKQKTEWQSDMGEVSGHLKGSYEDKINELDGRIKEISKNPEAADKYLSELSEPLYQRLKRQGYFDEVPVEAPIVRHAETDANVQGVIGKNDDKLNAKGVEQAQELGELLKSKGIVNVVSAPSERTKETAQHILDKTGGEMRINPDLRSWDRGDGHIADFDKKRYVNNPDERPGNGETFNEFLGRVQKLRRDAGRLPKDTVQVTSSEVAKLWEALDKNNGEWGEKAKSQFLKDSNDFDNAEVYRPGKGRGFEAKDKGVPDKSTPEPAKATEPSPERQKIEAEKESAPESERPYHEKRLKVLDKYGMTHDELIQKLKDEGRLKVECPPGTGGKRRLSLKDILSRKGG